MAEHFFEIDILLGRVLRLDTEKKAWPIKENIDKLDLIKIKDSCSMKNPLKRKKQITY